MAHPTTRARGLRLAPIGFVVGDEFFAADELEALRVQEPEVHERLAGGRILASRAAHLRTGPPSRPRRVFRGDALQLLDSCRTRYVDGAEEPLDAGTRAIVAARIRAEASRGRVVSAVADAPEHGGGGVALLGYVILAVTACCTRRSAVRR